MIKIATGKLNRSQLKQHLLDRIAALEVGVRLPPERVLAEEFGVCRSTMSKVMADLALEGYISRRIGSGSFVLPRNQSVRTSSASYRASGEIIIVYPDFFSFDIWEKVHYAEVAAMRSRRLLLSLKMQPESDYNLLFEMAGECRNLEGILMANCTNLTTHLLQRLDEFDVPVVLLGEAEEINAYRNIYSIQRNHIQSGFLKMNSVITAGHRRIGIITNEPATIASRNCLKGMKDAVYRHKMRWSDIAKPEEEVENWTSPTAGAYRQTLEVMQKHPDVTALVVDTASGATGALRALADLKLRCPEDVSMVTAYSYMGQEEFTCPRLTSVVGPSAESIIDAAMQIITAKKQTASRLMILDVKLIERESLRQPLTVGERESASPLP